MSIAVTPFLHEGSGTWSYIAADPGNGRAAIIDPVLEFDAASGRTATRGAQRIADHIAAHALDVRWILETHAHADHLSAAQWFKARFDTATLAIGEGIRAVQTAFAPLLDPDGRLATDGSQFDRLFADGERFTVGGIDAEAIAVPGHTSDSMAYRIGDAVFVGDSIFMPDSGTARCDFPGGDARLLYRSIQRLYALPGDTRVFVCHDYAPGGRAHACRTTIAAQRAGNIHVRDGVDEDAFVAVRTARDATLPVPALLLPSVQVNLRGGRLPEPDGNGVRYLRIPVDRF